MSPYPGGLVGFGLAAMLTHALLGYTAGAVLFGRGRAGCVGGLLPDCDHLLGHVLGGPFGHRGVTHSLLAVGFIAGLASRADRRGSAALGVGALSHVLLDATTPMGVLLYYPLSIDPVAVLLYGHSPRTTGVVVLACLLALALGGVRRQFWRS